MTKELSFSKLIMTFKLFCDKGYLPEKDIPYSLGMILYDYYSDIIPQIEEHGNVGMFTIIGNLVSKSKFKQPLLNYIYLYFAVYFEGNKPRLHRQNLNNNSNFYRANNVVKFNDFLLLRNILGKIKKEHIEKIIDSYPDSSDWRESLANYLKWPSVDAPEAVKKMFSVAFSPIGILSHENYHVGELSELAKIRWRILDHVFVEDYQHLVSEFGEEYVDEWGNPLTITRLMKMANTIAALCRNAKRSPNDMSKAIGEWESDLAYLKRTYYDRWISDAEDTFWPSTSAMVD